MTDERKDDDAMLADGNSTRRSLLKIGAILAPAVVTLKPAMAQAQVSMALCRIPIEDFITAEGKVTQNPNQGFGPPPQGYYLGEDLLRYKDFGTPSGVTEEQFGAHLKYIKSLRPSDQGYTCLTSLVTKL